MEEKHWPLVIMTLLSQMAVGLLFFQVALGHFLDADRVAPFVEFVCLISVGIAFLASIFHLGCPGNAINAIRNIKSSWLSREALCTGVFSGCLTIQLSGHLTDVRFHLEIPTLLVGLFLIYAMSKVYYLSAVPTWRGRVIMIDFFLSAILLGSLTYCLLLVWMIGGSNFITAVAGVFLLIRLFQSFSGGRDQIFLSIAAFSTWLMFLAGLPFICILACLALVFSREYLARNAFYHSYKRNGV